MNQLKLTEQETLITNYLQSKNGAEVVWGELFRFSKDPSKVKLNTIQKVVSEIKRKYVIAGLDVPFSVKFLPIKDASIQKLIQIQVGTPTTKDTRHQAQIDFKLDYNQKRVGTKYGFKKLNDSEWEVFKYIHANPGRIVLQKELSDKVVFHNYGSKLPARWFDTIGRIIGNLRKQVDGLDKRLLTVRPGETGYLFQ